MPIRTARFPISNIGGVKRTQEELRRVLLLGMLATLGDFTGVALLRVSDEWKILVNGNCHIISRRPGRVYFWEIVKSSELHNNIVPAEDLGTLWLVSRQSISK